MSPSIEDTADHLLACEQALLDPATRRDRSQVSTLLAEDFIEFGSSGRKWSRDEILAHLETEDYAPPILEDFTCRLIAEGVALVTYRTVRTNDQTGERHVNLRSSLWVRDAAGNWLLRFHQGARIPQ
jgi:hypothetical protein